MKNESVSHILTYDYLKSVHKDKMVSEIAEETGCGKSTVRKYLHKYGLSIKKDYSNRSGKNNPNWKGGRYIHNGYVMIKVGKNKYRREHNVVIEKHIGRPLYHFEIVHHLDGNRSNNDINNLLVMEKREHDRYHQIVRNKNIDYTKHNVKDVLDTLYPESYQELKMYAELTRIGSVRSIG